MLKRAAKKPVAPIIGDDGDPRTHFLRTGDDIFEIKSKDLTFDRNFNLRNTDNKVRLQLKMLGMHDIDEEVRKFILAPKSMRNPNQYSRDEKQIIRILLERELMNLLRKVSGNPYTDVDEAIPGYDINGDQMVNLSLLRQHILQSLLDQIHYTSGQEFDSTQFPEYEWIDDMQRISLLRERLHVNLYNLIDEGRMDIDSHAYNLWKFYQEHLSRRLDAENSKKLHVYVVFIIGEPQIQNFKMWYDLLTSNVHGDHFDFAIYHHDLANDLWKQESFYFNENIVVRSVDPVCKVESWQAFGSKMKEYTHIFYMDEDLDCRFFDWSVYRAHLIQYDPNFSQPAIARKSHNAGIGGGAMRAWPGTAFRVREVQDHYICTANSVIHKEVMSFLISTKIWPAIHSFTRNTVGTSVWGFGSLMIWLNGMRQLCTNEPDGLVVYASPVMHGDLKTLPKRGFVTENSHCLRGQTELFTKQISQEHLDAFVECACDVPRFQWINVPINKAADIIMDMFGSRKFAYGNESNENCVFLPPLQRKFSVMHRMDVENCDDRTLFKTKELKPHEAEYEKHLMIELLGISSSFFEWGSLMTQKAARCGNLRRIISIKSDVTIIETSRAMEEIKYAMEQGFLDMQYIAANDDPGSEMTPSQRSEYLGVLSKTSTAWDLILVNGAFRVACALNAILYAIQTDANPTICVMNTKKKSYVPVLQKYLQIYREARLLSCFKIKPAPNIQIENLQNDIEYFS